MPAAIEVLTRRLRTETRGHGSTNSLIPVLLNLCPSEVPSGTAESSRDKVKAIHLCFFRPPVITSFIYDGFPHVWSSHNYSTTQMHQEQQFLGLVYS